MMAPTGTCAAAAAQPRGGTAGPAAKARLRAQAGALFRKSWQFQARNVATNACLLAAPILFCVLLVLLKVGINKLLSGDEYACGCQCTMCCFDGSDTSNCTVMRSSACPYTCLQHNHSNCGLQFSVGAQAAFCDIPHASTWPPIMQSPPEAQRAAPYRPKLAMLYLPGSDAALSRAITDGLLRQPQLQAGGLLAAQRYLAAFAADMPASSYTLPGEALALLGLLRLGSTSRLPQQGGLTLETALIGPTKNLHMLWPNGTCAQLGLGGSPNTSLTTALQALVNASNTPAAAALLNSRLQELAASLAADGGGAVSQVAGLRLNCTDVVLVKAASRAQLERALYCGYQGARCGSNGGSSSTRREANSYAAAFDWAGTAGGAAFAPLLFYNDTYGVPDDGTEVGTNYMRTPQLLNMAVNAWLRAVLGADASAELIGLGALPRRAWPVNLDWTPVVGPVLATWVMQILLPVFVGTLVHEKEQRLRMMMKMHGLGDAAYWLVHYAWFMAMYAAFMAAFVAFGCITGLGLFLANHWGVQLVLYLVWGHTMVAAAFLLSCLFSSARTAATACYLLVFASGLVGYLLLRLLLDLGEGVPWAGALEVLPGLALYRCLYELGAYAKLATERGPGTWGMTLASLARPDNGMGLAWAIMGAEAALMAALAWYLEQVYASGTGNRRHPLYFLGYPRDTQQQTQQAQAQGPHGGSQRPGGAAPRHARRPPGRQHSLVAAALGSRAARAVARLAPRGMMRGRRGSAAGLPQQQQCAPAAHNLTPADSFSSLEVAAAAPACGEPTAGCDHLPGRGAERCCVGGGGGGVGGPRRDGGCAGGSWTPDGRLVRALEPRDVAAERLRVAALRGPADLAAHPLIVRGLHKVYAAQDGQPPKVAVQRLDLAVARGECFGLLGPNGAGKSTSISMLTGLLQPTAGTAVIGGHDLRAGMGPIYSIMGMCPQHNLLWASLSGRQHLQFYGRLKGLTGAELEATVDGCLRAVKLFAGGVADKAAGSYSGGMQRRLSVAIALMGDPQVVYLDEPSTGLDPASRRTLWEVVRAAKAGRAIVLTTHSMEEAEELCDRLGIFVAGRLACIGRPKEITSRFCGFLLFTITVPAGCEGEARALVAGQLAPGAVLTYAVGGTLKYELPAAEVSMSRVFAFMAGSAAAQLGALDWAVASAGLEDVFIRFSRQLNLRATT